MPSLVDLYKDYKDKVQFVFLAHDDKNKVIDYLKKNKFNLPVYFEKTKAPTALNSLSLPTTYLIDKHSNIVIKEVGAADWDSKKLRNLLDTLLIKD